MPRLVKVAAVLAILITAFNLSVFVTALANNVAVRVCQNKHCCKRAAKDVDVLQTLNNLLVQREHDSKQTAVAVESVSCLSNCDMGPNVEITLPNGTSVVLHDMKDSQQSAVHLYELTTATDNDATHAPPFSPPKILLAASKVMETSQQLQSMDERIRYLTSVIDKLESSSSPYTVSAANAHAHALRAQAYYESSESNKDDEGLSKAIADAKYVTRDLASMATDSSLKTAFRAWVDAEVLLAQREKADYSRAVAVLQEWYQVQPFFRTKLQQEIQDLQRRR